MVDSVAVLRQSKDCYLTSRLESCHSAARPYRAIWRRSGAGAPAGSTSLPTRGDMLTIPKAVVRSRLGTWSPSVERPLSTSSRPFVDGATALKEDLEGSCPHGSYLSQISDAKCCVNRGFRDSSFASVASNQAKLNCRPIPKSCYVSVHACQFRPDAPNRPPRSHKEQTGNRGSRRSGSPSSREE